MAAAGPAAKRRSAGPADARWTVPAAVGRFELGWPLPRLNPPPPARLAAACGLGLAWVALRLGQLELLEAYLSLQWVPKPG